MEPSFSCRLLRGRPRRVSLRLPGTDVTSTCTLGVHEVVGARGVHEVLGTRVFGIAEA